MESCDKASEYPGTMARLSTVRMRPDARRSAETSLRQADLLVDLLMAAHADLRRAFGLIGYSLHAIARRSKAHTAAPGVR